MRQPDLAKTMVSLGEAAWSASTVSRAESGERSLSLSEFIALAYALGATPDELLDPTAFGDESDVQAPTGPIGARAFSDDCPRRGSDTCHTFAASEVASRVQPHGSRPQSGGDTDRDG